MVTLKIAILWDGATRRNIPEDSILHSMICMLEVKEGVCEFLKLGPPLKFCYLNITVNGSTTCYLVGQNRRKNPP
jgi:hypothetical protein